MAIFTNFANYLKCRSYFENTLGFKTLYTDPDHVPDTDNEEYATTDDIGTYGFLASMYNVKIAQNIWFLYGKSKPWPTYPTGAEQPIVSEDNPPLELESGFELTTTYNESSEKDKCGFLLDPAGSTTNLEFIGMKRLVPLPSENKSINDIRKEYKDVIQFRKLKENADPSYLRNYDEFLPTNEALNFNKPNSLKITTFYEYNDFEKDSDTNKEYNCRQIGMLNLLHAPIESRDLIRASSLLFNGIDNGKLLCNILNITELSINPTEEELKALNVHPVPRMDDYDSTDYSNSRDFLGVLHFYFNSIVNTRVTYQTDNYNFILSFENKAKCNCTCDNCLCND